MIRNLHKNICFIGVLLIYPITCQAMWDKDDPDRLAGDIIQLSIPAIALGITYAQNDSVGMVQWAKTIGVTAASTQALKYAFNNTALGTRPNGGSKSFPSGHVSSACSGAAFIGQRYGWQYGALAMLPATYVAWSRVEENLHHVRDVVAGCALATGIAMYFTHPKDNILVMPFIENGSVGFTIQSIW